MPNNGSAKENTAHQQHTTHKQNTLHKVAYYADIFYDSELSPAYWIPPANLDVDVILLGGDIHYTPQGLGDMLNDIRRTQQDSTTIVAVPGNGDYLGLQLDDTRSEYKAVVDAIPNAEFLDDETLLLPGGLRIIGSTLWSHVTEDLVDAYNQMWTDHGMNGVDNIKKGDRYLTIEDCNELHNAAVKFLDTELRRLSEAERSKTIVCTHFWPTLRPWPSTPDPEQPETKFLHMTGTDLDEMITEIGPKFWLCGHAHTSHEVTIGTTLVASNPRAGGHPDDPDHVNPQFAEHYVVEL